MRTSHFKGQKTIDFCTIVAYFNQLFFARYLGVTDTKTNLNSTIASHR
jgi:hypothetical protein